MDALHLCRDGEFTVRERAESLVLMRSRNFPAAAVTHPWNEELIESADRDRPLIQAINGALAEIAREGRSVQSQTEPRL
jgi:hypothetical protein